MVHNSNRLRADYLKKIFSVMTGGGGRDGGGAHNPYTKEQHFYPWSRDKCVTLSPVLGQVVGPGGITAVWNCSIEKPNSWIN